MGARNTRSRAVAVAMLTLGLVVAPGCQFVSEDIDEWPADMFNAPTDAPLLVSIPTWVGSVAGAAAGSILVPLSWMAAFFVDWWFPQVYSQEQDDAGLFVIHDGYDVAVMPMVGFGYVGGILTGTPFFALYYPARVTYNALFGIEREEEGELKVEFRERPIREERTVHPQNYPGG